MSSKTVIPACIAEKIDFSKVHSQADLNTAIGQAYDACAKEHPVECDCAKGERRKREPSAYNLFIGECMRSKPIAGKPFGTAGKYMGECAQSWREAHPKK
ncbi:MAG: hypothetical protein PHU23_05970 [Dehalococcoidales bacterium]|nr:hypothetical protein [Dehalococcoidales bacterium]